MPLVLISIAVPLTKSAAFQLLTALQTAIIHTIPSGQFQLALNTIFLVLAALILMLRPWLMLGSR